MEELLGYVKPVMAIDPVSKNNAAIVATAVDAQGYDRCCFLIMTGAVAATAGVSCRVQESATSGGSYTDRTTTAALTDFSGTASSSKIYGVDVGVNSAKPFMKLYGTCGTAAVLHGAVALLYRGTTPDPNLDTVISQYVRKP